MIKHSVCYRVITSDLLFRFADSAVILINFDVYLTCMLDCSMLFEIILSSKRFCQLLYRDF